MEKSEIKAKNDKEMFQEMFPFLLYALIPLLVTVSIAYYFGTTAQY
jgi:hypothetical protein